MGIALTDSQLELVLDEGVARARSKEPVPELWVRRVERLGTLGIKTYIAALGAALLAKATDDRVDSLAQDISAGPHGYSLRKVAEFLATHNGGRFHMGATGRWPVNNRPFLGGPARIDDFEKISRKARPAFDLFLDCLVDLNRMSSSDAQSAFIAWLRTRMAEQQRQQAERKQTRALSTGLDAATLIDVADRFVREDPEGGRRGQAFVAAALDCAFEDVVLQAINDPKPGDVQVRRSGKVVWLVEVKQVPVGEDVALELAAQARRRNVSLALLVVMADRQEPIDRERARRQALKDHRVMLAVSESVAELLATIAVFSTTRVEDIVGQLPGAYAARMREHGVSAKGQERWSQLMESRTITGL